MSDEERHIPTPKELEEGLLRRRRREEEGQEEAQEQVKRGGFSLLRRLGVGGRRKYEKPEKGTTPTKAGPRLVGREPPRPKESPPRAQGKRVESVKIPPRRKEAREQKYVRYSKEERFYQKAQSKGHTMGRLAAIPFTTNFEAFCDTCGMRGELVVEHEENYRNVTNDHSRGLAMERSCSDKKQS